VTAIGKQVLPSCYAALMVACSLGLCVSYSQPARLCDGANRARPLQKIPAILLHSGAPYVFFDGLRLWGTERSVIIHHAAVRGSYGKNPGTVLNLGCED